MRGACIVIIFGLGPQFLIKSFQDPWELQSDESLLYAHKMTGDGDP